MDTIFCAEQIEVPAALPGIMKAWTKEVIRYAPEDIITFSKQYFESLKGGQLEQFLAAQEQEANQRNAFNALESVRPSAHLAPPAGKPSFGPKNLPQEVPVTDLLTYAQQMVAHIFSLFDLDKSGDLSRKEVAKMCRNEAFIAKELPALRGASGAEIISMLDADNDGSVSKAEFQEALLKLFSSMVADRIVDHIFGLFDKDKSGSLEASELWALCRDQERLKKTIPVLAGMKSAEVAKLLDKDESDDGLITRQEFQKALQGFKRWKVLQARAA